MKSFLFAMALSLGVVLAAGTGGGSTTPAGTILDFAAAGTGGGSTTPAGTILDFA